MDEESSNGRREDIFSRGGMRLVNSSGWVRVWIVLSVLWTIGVITTMFYGFEPSGMTYVEREAWLSDVQAVAQFRNTKTYEDGIVQDEPYVLNADATATIPPCCLLASFHSFSHRFLTRRATASSLSQRLRPRAVSIRLGQGTYTQP